MNSDDYERDWWEELGWSSYQIGEHVTATCHVSADRPPPRWGVKHCAAQRIVHLFLITSFPPKPNCPGLTSLQSSFGGRVIQRCGARPGRDAALFLDEAVHPVRIWVVFQYAD